MKALTDLTFVSCVGQSGVKTCAAGPLTEVTRFYAYPDIPAVAPSGFMNRADIGDYIVRDASGRYRRMSAAAYAVRFTASGAITAPGTPTNGTITATTVPLNWANGDATATTEIWIAVGAGGSVYLATVAAGVTTYTATGLTTATAYHFKLRHNKYGNRGVASAFTAVLNATTS